MKKKTTDFGIPGILLLSLTFVFIFYGKVIISPNHFQFSDRGDAVKNYYTYAWYINNNISTTNFEGLNYPYGENIFYTDNTPVLSAALRIFRTIWPGISNYSIGIINFLLILSFIAESLLIYLILKELNVNIQLSVLSSLAIMALSPQIFRLTGHLALGFGFFIPLTIFLLLKLENKISGKLFVVLSVSVLLLFFVHAYLGMIATSIVFGYGLVRFLLRQKPVWEEKRIYLYLLFSVIIPMVVFRSTIYFTDTHIGRTTNPWGFFVAHSNFNSVFLPNHAPLKPFFKIIFPEFTQIWEGWAYIGIVSVITIVIYLFSAIIKSYKGKKLSIHTPYFQNNFLITLLISSILLLLFSMAFPFRLKLEWLLNYFPALKQFRAVGRFAWAFYFIITISSIYFIDQFIKTLLLRKKQIIAIILILAVPSVYFVEAIPYHSETSSQLKKSANMFDFGQLDAQLQSGIKKVDSTMYQAIFPLPFYYIGSENYGKFGTDKIYLLSQIISYHTKLPILGSYLTRTSIWESKNIMQVLAPEYYPKKIISDISSNKPFLVVFTHEDLTKYEQRILSNSTPIYENKDFSLYLLEKEILFNKTNKEELTEFLHMTNRLFVKEGFLTSDTSSYFYFNSFENNNFHLSMTGRGIYKGFKKNYNKLVHLEKNTLEPGQSYTASFWMYNEGENFGQDMLNSMFILQEKTNNVVNWAKIVNPAYSPVISDDWSLVEMEFSLDKSNTEVDFILKGDDLSEKPVYIDDFMIYKTNTLNYRVIRDDKDSINAIFKNNQYIQIK